MNSVDWEGDSCYNAGVEAFQVSSETPLIATVRSQFRGCHQQFRTSVESPHRSDDRWMIYRLRGQPCAEIGDDANAAYSRPASLAKIASADGHATTSAPHC